MSFKSKIANLPSKEELRDSYIQGKSIAQLAQECGCSEKTISNRLHELPDWEAVKCEVEASRKVKRVRCGKFNGVCKKCNTPFAASRRAEYCSSSCYKSDWSKGYRDANKDHINDRRRERRAAAEKKLTERDYWKERFLAKVAEVHKRKIDDVVGRILKRIDSVKNGLVTRSRKHGVACTVTVEELRCLFYDAYGTPCRYCGRVLTIKNMVVDHIVPISKGGDSSKENLQVICKSSNSMKGSLDESSFLTLLAWLDTVSEDLRKDITIRLARGIH